MKKLLILSIACIPLVGQADVHNDLTRCSAIENDSERLDCYDTVSAHYRTKLANVSLPNNNSAADNKSVSKIVKQAEAKKIIQQKEISTAEDTFGKTEAEINQLDSMTANIVGEFKGWRKGVVLTLSNGQKWKIRSNSTGYVNLNNPKVEITRGVFGSFSMKVEGLNAKAKVRRVE